MLISNIAEYVIFHCAALIPAYYNQTTTVVPGNITSYRELSTTLKPAYKYSHAPHA